MFTIAAIPFHLVPEPIGRPPLAMHEYEADDYDEDDAETTAKCKRCALGDFLPVVVLSLIVVGFCVLGGYIFMKIETDQWSVM